MIGKRPRLIRADIVTSAMPSRAIVVMVKCLAELLRGIDLVLDGAVRAFSIEEPSPPVLLQGVDGGTSATAAARKSCPGRMRRPRHHQGGAKRIARVS